MKHDNNFYKIPAQKYPNKAFLVPILMIFCTKKLNLEKFDGVYFKHGNTFLKFQPKITQIRHFSFQI